MSQRSVQFIEFGPKSIGNGVTTVFSVSCRLRYLRISNRSGSTINVSVQDMQGSPVDIIPPGDILGDSHAGGLIEISPGEDGDKCPGGLTITASLSGLHVYARATPWSLN